MRAASAKTLAIMSSSQYSVADMWQVDLVAPLATSLYFTNWDTPLTVGQLTYGTPLILDRGALTRTNTLSPQTLELDIYPQLDTPSPVTLGNIGLIAAFQRGYFDSAIVRLSKLFMAMPGDVSAGLTPWFTGRISTLTATRSGVKATIEELTALLNVAMPRNVYQTGCLHTLYDAGCTMKKINAQGAGVVTGNMTSTLTAFTCSGLTQAGGFFDLGTILWNTGQNAGRNGTVKSYGGTSFKLAAPLDAPPAVGDRFTAWAGCDKTQATCSTKFGNLLHFRGYPYIPVPETLYSGGVDNPQISLDGGTGTSIVGSAANAAKFAGTYKT